MVFEGLLAALLVDIKCDGKTRAIVRFEGDIHLQRRGLWEKRKSHATTGREAELPNLESNFYR
jgi:hypothetical protein